MCLFAAGMVVALAPSAIFVALMFWRGGIDDAVETDARVVPFPRRTGKSTSKAALV
jgi:hypothetical protein